jgi:hypothetical protein
MSRMQHVAHNLRFHTAIQLVPALLPAARCTHLAGLVPHVVQLLAADGTEALVIIHWHCVPLLWGLLRLL